MESAEDNRCALDSHNYHFLDATQFIAQNPKGHHKAFPSAVTRWQIDERKELKALLFVASRGECDEFQLDAVINLLTCSVQCVMTKRNSLLSWSSK